MHDEIIQIISTELGIPAAELTPEVRLRSLPGVESMKVLSIILKVEKKYGIELPDDATFRLETVGQFLDLVKSLRS